MAFYKEFQKDRKKDRAARGSFEEEGSRYRPSAGGDAPRRSGKPAAGRRSETALPGSGKPYFRTKPEGAPEEKRTAFHPAGGRPVFRARPEGAPEEKRTAFHPAGGRPVFRARPEDAPEEKRTAFHPVGGRPAFRARPEGAPEERKATFRPAGGRPAFRPRPEKPVGERKPFGRPVPAREHSEGEPAYKRYEHKPAAPIPPRQAEEAIDPMENLLSGRNPIREAIKSGRDIEKLLVAKGDLSGSAREIVAMAREARIPVQEVDRVRLDEITKNHQGMLAFASAYQYATVEDMLSEAQEKGEVPFVILLDGITDPHNLGAIIRTAECVGAHGVIVPERRSVGLTPAAVKASAGAVEHVKVARVTNLNRTLEDLKKAGLWIAAAVTDGTNYQKADLTGPLALVIGSEGEGISRLVLENCDRKVSLPLKGKIGSLNASVAAGILMYAVLQKRNEG